jgi:hypothetical protein
VDKALVRTKWPACREELEYEQAKAKYRGLVDHYQEAKRCLVKAYHLGLEPESKQGL